VSNIPNDKQAVSVTLAKNLIDLIEKDAKLEMRNRSSQIAYIIIKYYEDKLKDDIIKDL
jgi:metal-responsive CopG/Arc/MetJ family transcriptional regulator